MSSLTELYEEIDRCRDCDLAEHRNQVVPGEGAEDAQIMFIGEAPGFHEDRQGRPFVGPAGHFLDELLASIGLSRDEVYICNVVKCRPPGNRDPLPKEIEACQKWLDRQIEIIQPQMIVTLGRYSMARFFPRETISKIHGKYVKRGDVIYFAMYHPAATLHQQKLRQIIEADIRKIPEILSQVQTGKIIEAEKKEERSKQLSMF